ncbi:TPA: hypothetical protein ENX78_02500 [Candidatus Poribacteria bacterium]|nr:hypothetical protein [Candidatus Poribacteria bacterium]
MDIRYINRTDVVVSAVSVLNLIFMSINTALESLILFYLGNIIAIACLIYWGILKDATKYLARSLLIGGIVGVIYTVLDNLLAEVNYINYLRIEDIKLLSTPISVVLFWIFLITTMIYLYHRLRSTFSRFIFPSIITGSTAFLFSLVLFILGDISRQWVWSIGEPPMLSIGPIPLYVPLALFVTFFLSPYIVGIPGAPVADEDSFFAKYFKVSNNPLSGGIRCTIILSLSIYGLLQLFSRL